jgi:putative peptide zinc metalloprotease protein
VRVRGDLRSVTTRHKYDTAVVVKDPIAMKYHRMRPDEYFVLEMLDGQHSLDEIKQAYEIQYPPQKVSAVELNQLLFRFHQSGLTVSDTIDQGDRLDDRRRKERRSELIQHISGVLFIRFPGIDPEPFLRRLSPWVQPLLSPAGMIVTLFFCCFAFIVFLTRWDIFAAEFPKINQWIRLDSVLILAAVIGGTKVLHELGHALVCKRFGGECHQIGPMLLVFTPALYCDTSDSWMLPNRFARAAVGLAGIATEVGLAAIATLVWANSAPGLVHYIAMNVMLVCSISTVMFNANPLLRYDGYYVLSDLWDIPNLGQRSKHLLTAHANKLLFGADEHSTEPLAKATHFWMLVYALLAFAYRWALTLVILWFVSMILRPYRLESIGRMLFVFAAGGMLFALLRGPYQFLKNPARRRKLQMKRTVISMISITALIGCCFVPLPSGISATAKLIPRSETPVYVTTAGLLKELHRMPGDIVAKGDAIATLSNPDVELQFLQAKGQYDAQVLIVQSIERSAFDSPEAANDLPGQKAVLEDLAQRVKSRQARLDALVIYAPVSGQLIAGPRRSEDTAADAELRMVSWSGFPTESANQNCLLDAGSELISIIGDERWDAEITIAQSEVHRIAIGNPVKLALESMPSKTFTGTVVEIALDRWNDREHTDRRSDPQAARYSGPVATSYLARVELQPDLELPLVTGAIATTRIDAERSTLAARAMRTLNGLVRFR